MDILKRIGKNVRACRTAASLSQEELAGRIDVDQGYISKLESGQINVTATTLQQLADALQVEAKELV